MATLGARIVAIEPGFCAIEMGYATGVSQQQGFFHGGAIGAIADSAAGYAAYSLMPAGSRDPHRRIQAQPDPPGVPPTLRAEGRVLRAGRTLTVCRADVYPCGAGRAGGLRAAAVDADAGGAGGRESASKKEAPAGCQLETQRTNAGNVAGLADSELQEPFTRTILTHFRAGPTLAACTTYVLGNRFEDDGNPVDN